MRQLHGVILGLCLLVGLLTGAMTHAAEVATFGEVTQATQWLHADGDHDEVPADSDRDYPHHHTVCHGHDLAAPLKACGAPAHSERVAAPRPRADLALAAGPPAHALRPPIA